MACIRKPDFHPIRQTDNFIVAARHEMFQHPFCICHGIERRFLRPSCSLGFSVLPLCLRLLNMGAVLQHNIAEVAGGPGRHNLSGKASRKNKRQKPHMVNVGMNDKHIVNVPVADRQLCVFIFVRALLHSAVNQDLKTAGLEIMAASRNLVGRPNEHQLHITLSFPKCGCAPAHPALSSTAQSFCRYHIRENKCLRSRRLFSF